ncbi:MAG: hypothetical protein IIV99_05395 [Oscillospiraceae bacterium]|nr:hypothetical protein [Oscillospiraceae bacterium]
MNEVKVEIYRRKNGAECVYFDRYLEMQKKQGLWYQISPKSRYYYDYSQEFLDLGGVDGEHLIIFLNKKFRAKLISFIKDLLEDNSTEYVCFFADLQGYEEKECHLNAQEFMALLQNDLLHYNTVYHIKDNW